MFVIIFFQYCDGTIMFKRIFHIKRIFHDHNGVEFAIRYVKRELVRFACNLNTEALL